MVLVSVDTTIIAIVRLGSLKFIDLVVGLGQMGFLITKKYIKKYLDQGN